MKKNLGLSILLSIVFFATAEIMPQKRCGCNIRPRIAKIKPKPKKNQKTGSQDKNQEITRCGCNISNKTTKRKKKKPQVSRRLLRRFRA